MTRRSPGVGLSLPRAPFRLDDPTPAEASLAPSVRYGGFLSSLDDFSLTEVSSTTPSLFRCPVSLGLPSPTEADDCCLCIPGRFTRVRSHPADRGRRKRSLPSRETAQNRRSLQPKPSESLVPYGGGSSKLSAASRRLRRPALPNRADSPSTFPACAAPASDLSAFSQAPSSLRPRPRDLLA